MKKSEEIVAYRIRRNGSASWSNGLEASHHIHDYWFATTTIEALNPQISKAQQQQQRREKQKKKKQLNFRRRRRRERNQIFSPLSPVLLQTKGKKEREKRKEN